MANKKIVIRAFNSHALLHIVWEEIFQDPLVHQILL